MFFTVVIALVGIGAREQGLTDDPNSAFIEAALSAGDSSPLIGAIVLLTVFSAVLSTADTETFLISGFFAREIARFRGSHDTADISRTVTVKMYQALIVTVAISAAFISVVAGDLVKVYTILLFLLMALAPPVLVGAVRPLSSKIVVSSIIIGILLLVGLLSYNILSVDYAVVIVIPGLLLCIIGAVAGNKK